MGSPLDRLKLKGFRSIQALDLKLSPLTVMIGANGAGKSNLISFFSLLNSIVSGQLANYVGKCGGADSLLHFGRKVTDKIEIETIFGRNSYRSTLEPNQKDAFFFSEESVGFSGDLFEGFRFHTIGSGHSESKLTSTTEGQSSHKIAQHVIPALKSWKVFHFHDTSETAKVKQICKINDNKELRPDAANLAAVLYSLKTHKTEHYDSIVNTTKLIAPFFDDFVLEPEVYSEENIRLQWKHKNSDSYFDANQLSDGTIRTICLVTLLNQPILPSTILIDEPELGLHPFAIQVLTALFKSVAIRTQLLVSTQSVPMINQLRPEDVLVANRKDGATEFNSVTSDQLSDWIEEFGLGDLWEKNLLGGRPGG